MGNSYAHQALKVDEHGLSYSRILVVCFYFFQPFECGRNCRKKRTLLE